MSIKKLFTFSILVLILASSCSAPKKVRYFQDITAQTQIKTSPGTTVKIQPYDKLAINVTGQDDRINSQLNLYSSNNSGSRDNYGYTVDSEGYIDFPLLGRIHVAGMTREQVADYIKTQLQSHNYVSNPVVTVGFSNLSVTLLGEVSSPGQYPITKDNITLLEALSLAGDLTIHGRRDNVMVIRTIDGVEHNYYVNLNKAQDVFSSPVYYLRQGDVIYVEPNGTRKSQADNNASTFRNVTFWMSLTSFLMSTAILVTNLVK